MGDLLDVSELTTEEVYRILHEAERFREGESWKPDRLTFAANLFFEPSTRTRFSFEVAQKRLGLETLQFSAEQSSAEKGETLYDTVRTLEEIGAGVVVIRHKKDHFYQSLKGNITIPIINAGDGCGNHPTQSLLDALTIYQEFQTFAGLNIVIVGDVKHSRVARSNARLLRNLGANVKISGPEQWYEQTYGEYVDFSKAVKEADVLMMLRIQHERHDECDDEVLKDYHRKYGLTKEREKAMKKTSIIMHPAPVNRDVEIASELIESPRSRIFKQMNNGVYVRMAVLKRALESLGRDGAIQ